MTEYSDKQVLEAWNVNARFWVKQVRSNSIASRRLVTNRAILEAVLSTPARTVLDIGCGEGWLGRELLEKGLKVSGVDGVAELVKQANQGGGGQFFHLAYEDICESTITDKYDLVVCNFALLGKEVTEHIFTVVPSLLKPKGFLIVQTVHPLMYCDKGAYQNGWKMENWDAFENQSGSPAPWYFRTTESWVQLFHNNGLSLVQFQEPLNPETGRPASLLLCGQVE